MSEVAAALSAWAPEAASQLEEVESLAAGVSGRVGQLARLRIAWLLGGAGALERQRPSALAAGLDEQTVAAIGRWTTSPLFDGTDRACLALAEQFVIDVSGVTDADVDAVLQRLGPSSLYGFVQTLWAADMAGRMRLALGAVLSGDAGVDEGSGK